MHMIDLHDPKCLQSLQTFDGYRGSFSFAPTETAYRLFAYRLPTVPTYTRTYMHMRMSAWERGRRCAYGRTCKYLYIL